MCYYNASNLDGAVPRCEDRMPTLSKPEHVDKPGLETRIDAGSLVNGT